VRAPLRRVDTAVGYREDVDAGAEVDDDSTAALQRLAQLYMPSRYPDALPEGTPASHFGPSHSAQALEDAERVIRLARDACVRLETAGQRRAVAGDEGPVHDA
jgi:hypothetical protein